MLPKNAHDKYRKNRKNNEFNKNQDLESKEAKKCPEMSANIAKVTRNFLAIQKHEVTNMAEIARMTKATKFQS